MARAARLFDLDGTVWDSHPWFAALVGRDNLSARKVALAALAGKHPAARLLKDAGITEAQFGRLCRGDFLVETYPAVVDTLQRLKRKRHPLAAVTNLPAWLAVQMLESVDLARFFGSVITWGSTRRRKPHPDPILHALDDLAIKPSRRIWYVGDTAGDYAAAEAAGISFAWASWGYASHPPDGAQRTLDSFEDVLAL